jgi:PBSX family phage portal protein
MATRKNKTQAKPRVMFVQKRGSGKHAIQKRQDVIGDPNFTEEDARSFLEQAGFDKGVIPPPFDFMDLERLFQKNTILPALVETMETNIDGTGVEFVPVSPIEDMVIEGLEDPEGEEFSDEAPFEDVDPGDLVAMAQAKKDRADRKREATRARDAVLKGRRAELSEMKTGLEEFFREAWPGQSFMTTRRKLRRDLEVLGNGYLEVLRNLEGTLIGLRWIDAKFIRLVKFDDPIEITKTLRRGGEDLEMTFSGRERRYIEVVGRSAVYHKEFGATRDIDKKTGEWATGAALAPEKRGTELVHFTMKKDAGGPYGIPRWISNIASVVGSRRAEEFNLDFFNSGGVPPLLIIVQGGALAEDAEQSLQESFVAGGNNHTAAVLEAFSTSGDMDSSQNVKVTVERFGSDRQSDSMFEGYIEKCDTRVKRAFRIAAIFMGMGGSSNFATATIEMMTTDAQVFNPERLEFDEVINLLIMPELKNGDQFIYRSLPLAAENLQQQLEAMGLVKDMVEPDSLIDQVNQSANLALEPRSKEDMPSPEEAQPAFVQAPGTGEPGPDGAAGDPPEAGNTQQQQQSTQTAKAELDELARRTAWHIEHATPLPDPSWIEVRASADALDPQGFAMFRGLLSKHLYGEQAMHDPAGCAELAALQFGRRG